MWYGSLNKLFCNFFQSNPSLCQFFQKPLTSPAHWLSPFKTRPVLVREREIKEERKRKRERRSPESSEAHLTLGDSMKNYPQAFTGECPSLFIVINLMQQPDEDREDEKLWSSVASRFVDGNWVVTSADGLVTSLTSDFHCVHAVASLTLSILCGLQGVTQGNKIFLTVNVLPQIQVMKRHKGQTGKRI